MVNTVFSKARVYKIADSRISTSSYTRTSAALQR